MKRAARTQLTYEKVGEDIDMRTFEQLRREVAKAGPHGIFRLAHVRPHERPYLDRFCHLAAVEQGGVSVYRVDFPSGLAG